MILSCLVLSLAASAAAHFVLQLPTSLGFDDEKEATGPCGNEDPSDRSKGVTDWAIGGGSIGLLTTHPSASWEINVALAGDATGFVPLVQPFKQTAGVGSVCFRGIPGFEAWEGRDAVLQLVQTGADGKLFQCAAIRFVAGGPGSVTSSCSSSKGVVVEPIVPAGAPPGGSASSSSGPSAVAPPSSTVLAGSTLSASGTAAASSKLDGAAHPTGSAPASPSGSRAGAPLSSSATKPAPHTTVTAGAERSKRVHRAVIGGAVALGIFAARR